MVVKSSAFGGQPNLMQGFLQIDDDLAAVGKHQGNHAASALVVNVGLGVVIDPVTTGLNDFEYLLCQVHEFCVGHNFTMLLIHQILVRTLSLGAVAVALLACGQQGALYLPPSDGSHRATLPETLIPAMAKPKATVPGIPMTSASVAKGL